MTLVYLDGRLGPGPALLAADDAGFLYGDGLFETLRVDDGRARDVEAHLDRLEAGAARIGLLLPESRAELAGAVAAVAAVAPRPVARLRLTVTRGRPHGGPTRLVVATPYEPPAPELYLRGVAAIVASGLRLDSRSPLAGLKSLSYQLQRMAWLRAEAAGAFEAILLNERDRVVEGSRSNLVAALPEGLLTPPLADGCLAGTTRRRLLESGRVREHPLSPRDLSRSRGLWLINSLIGALPVGRLDGVPLPVDAAAELRDLPASIL